MDTYPKASLRMLMAEVVIVRECTHGQVRVLYGDIVGVEGEVMVIPANSRLAGREGLDERKQQAAGDGLREACANICKREEEV
jgi:Predicted phosphatase homologous to the C-terminal domain of histone macroH2A1